MDRKTLSRHARWLERRIWQRTGRQLQGLGRRSPSDFLEKNRKKAGAGE
jgi:hypothetical protein